MNSPQAKPLKQNAIITNLWVYLKPHKRKFFISLFVGLMLAISAPVIPYLVQYSIDNYIKKGLLSPLIWIGCAQLIFLLFDTGLRFLFSYFSSWIGQNIIQEIRINLFKKILSLNLRQFDKTPIGVFCTRTVDDCERINDIFANGLLPVIIDITSVIAILSYMLFLNVQLTLVALSPFPILIIASYFFKNTVSKSFHHVRNAVAALNTYINEHLAGIKTIKAFTAEHNTLSGFNIHNSEHKRQNIKSIFAYSIFFPVVEIISALSIGVLVWWAASAKNTTGEIVSFIVCINTIFRPLRIIADKFNTIQMGLLAASRVFNVMHNTDITPQGKITPSKNLNGNIIFKDVVFSYLEQNPPTLNKISFEVRQGESLAILGRTGSGKTTIISLLNKLYQHQSGSISIDGLDIEEYETTFLRSQIGYVSQDVFLFAGSIYENITVGRSTLSLDKVKSICKELGIDKMIERLPNKYNFEVLEGGSNLSTGERQIVSIARVFAMNPAIIIFDEATASIDPKIEGLIDFASQKLFINKTAIIIAHRKNTIQKSKKILVLDEGVITEQGTPKELLKQKGYYFDLISK